jgi:hypothetical protein
VRFKGALSLGCAAGLLSARSYMETRLVERKDEKIQTYPRSVDTSAVLHTSLVLMLIHCKKKIIINLPFDREYHYEQHRGQSEHFRYI